MVWTLTPAGHRLAGGTSRKVRYQLSITHIRHVLAITELGTGLVEHTREHDLELTLQAEPDCWRSFDTATPPLKPDLHLTVANDDLELCWFVEIDRGTESPTAITKKLQRYTNYWRTGIEQDRHDIFPLTLWVAFDQHRADQIKQTIDNAGRVEQKLFQVTTAAKAINTLCDFGDGDSGSGVSDKQPGQDDGMAP